MENMRGRTGLVTGAGGGLGAYIARSLASEGVNLVLADRRKADTNDLAKELKSTSVEVAQIGADLSKPGGRAGVVARAEDELGPLDILVNNAGLEFGGPFVDAETEEIEAIAAVNLIAVMELTRQALPGMLERRSGHIVNVASMAGKVHSPYLATYSATKHGVVGFTHSLRAEMGNRPVGFSVICPTFITDVGMYARVEHAIEDPPPDAMTQPPDAVGAAVVEAIREDRAEVKVIAGPAALLAGASAAAPGLMARLLHRRAPSLEDARRVAAVRRKPEDPASL